MRILLHHAFLLVFFIHQAGAQAPVAGFEASVTTVDSGIPVSFTDLSENSPDQWAWDFGAEAFPKVSGEQHPEVAWATPGTYDVTLTVSNASGSDTRTLTGYITVLPYSPPAVNPVVIGTETLVGAYPLSSGRSLQSAALYASGEVGSRGVIESLAWYAQNAEVSRPMKIYLKHTTATSLHESHWNDLTAGATLVYEGSIANNAGEWIELALQTPFEYDGTGNLLVMGFSEANSNTKENAGIAYTPVTGMHQYWVGNGSGPSTAHGTIDGNRPNLRIRFREYSSPVANFIEEFRFFEDFEGSMFPPAGWTISDASGGKTWDHSTAHNISPEGSRSAWHEGGKNNDVETGTLITPLISLPQGDALLSFWSRNINAGSYVKNSVLISTTGTKPEDFTLLWSPAMVDDMWTQTTIDLKAYNGQDIYIAFMYEGARAHSWHLDEVTVAALRYNFLTVTQGEALVIQDKSTGGPMLWEWTTPGATPAVHYTQDADLVYEQPGLYDVTLRVGNPFGINTKTVAGFVYVLPEGEAISHTEWTGTDDSNWANTHNWSNGVPANGQDVVIGTAPNRPLLETGAVAGKLTISEGAGLTIGSHGKLTVIGTLANHAGAQGLVVGSDGSLIHDTPGVEATVKRMVESGWDSWDDGWHMVSSPVGAQTLAAITTSGAAGDGFDLYGWDEPTATWMNYKAAGFEAWNGGSDMVAGKGYLISYELQEAEKTFEGMLNVDDIALADLTLGSDPHSGWHLLGNPFAADLQWNDGNWDLTGVAATAKIWSEKGRSYLDIAPNGIIPLAQGFMIQVTDPASTITIPAASRLHSNLPWYKNQDIRRVRLVAREHDNRSFQHNQIVINPRAPEPFDNRHDARFLEGYAPQFYSMKADEMLSTLSLPYVYDGMIITMGFTKNEGSIFSIELEEALYGTELYLMDRKLGVKHHLTRLDPYQFTSEEGDDPLRFELHFGEERAAGIPAASLADSLQVYAAGNTLHLNFTEEGQGRSFEVYDMNGRRLMAQELDPGTQHVHSLNLPGGIYLVRVIMPGEVVTQKVVVESW